MANFCFQDGRFAHSKLLFRNVKKFFTFIFCFFADVARQNFMYTRFSFTAVVAFGDENLFAVVSWRKSGIYSNKVVSISICNNNGCLLQRTQFV